MGRAWGGRDDDRLIVDPIRGWDVMLAGVGRMGRHTLQKYWLVCFCWGGHWPWKLDLLLKAVNLVVGFRLSQVLRGVFSGQVQIAFSTHQAQDWSVQYAPKPVIGL